MNTRRDPRAEDDLEPPREELVHSRPQPARAPSQTIAAQTHTVPPQTPRSPELVPAGRFGGEVVVTTSRSRRPPPARPPSHASFGAVKSGSGAAWPPAQLNRPRELHTAPTKPSMPAVSVPPPNLPPLTVEVSPPLDSRPSAEPLSHAPSEHAPPLHFDGPPLDLNLGSLPPPPAPILVSESAASTSPAATAPLASDDLVLDDLALVQPMQRTPESDAPGAPDAALVVALDTHVFAPPTPSVPSAPLVSSRGHSGVGGPLSVSGTDAVPSAPSSTALAAQAVLKSLPSHQEVRQFARNIAVASIGGDQARVIKPEDPSTWIKPMAGPLIAFALSLVVAVVSVLLTRGGDSQVNLSWLYVPLLLGSLVFGVIRWIRLQG